MMILAGLLVTLCGFGIGGVLAWVFRLGKPQIIAVSVETAIQNSAIALIVVQTSFEPPYNDVASITPIAQLIIVGIPLWISVMVIQIRKRLGKDKNVEESGPEEKEVPGESEKTQLI